MWNEVKDTSEYLIQEQQTGFANTGTILGPFMNNNILALQFRCIYHFKCNQQRKRKRTDSSLPHICDCPLCVHLLQGRKSLHFAFNNLQVLHAIRALVLEAARLARWRSFELTIAEVLKFKIVRSKTNVSVAPAGSHDQGARKSTFHAAYRY